MDFSDALLAVKSGQRVTRRIWQGTLAGWAGCWLELIPAGGMQDGRECMPQLMVGYSGSDVLRPFAGANFDLLADDWEQA